MLAVHVYVLSVVGRVDAAVARCGYVHAMSRVCCKREGEEWTEEAIEGEVRESESREWVRESSGASSRVEILLLLLLLSVVHTAIAIHSATTIDCHCRA